MHDRKQAFVPVFYCSGHHVHGVLACQSCHQSMHGLYPVRSEGEEGTVDWTSHQQALQFSPDGKYAGPVTCAACHTVNQRGVPVQLRQTDYEADIVKVIPVLMPRQRASTV